MSDGKIKLRRILLDLDDVLVDFVSAALRVHSAEDLDRNGVWDLTKLLGISNKEFWDKIDAEGPMFWFMLEKFSWFNELVELCESYSPVVAICTSPSLSAVSAQGKKLWLNSCWANRPYAITNSKEMLAAPDVWLLDDRDRNVERFREAGGRASIFPTTGNLYKSYADDPMLVVRDSLETGFIQI